MTPYYQDEAVTLFCGDCREILPTLEAVDHVITDPPYSAETHSKTWRSKMMAEQGYDRVSAAHDGLGFAAITDEEVRAFLAWSAANCHRWVIAFSDIEGVWRWVSELRASGLEYVRTCVWDKVDGTPQWALRPSYAAIRQGASGGTVEASAAFTGTPRTAAREGRSRIRPLSQSR
jgi:DNA modification methylase